ncbi:MAG: hydrogenase maturation protease [Gammaproteobacteria bacterium]|nr:MAG: hydrogenase maturation protease [Gammaproteobacteria bacterium]
MHLLRHPLPAAEGEPAVTTIRIIGLGSPFGADRIGLLAARRLAREVRLPPGVEVIERDRPGLRLLEDFTGARAVLLLDALAGGIPGRVREVERSALLARAAPLSSHALGVAEALALAEALGRLPEAVGLLGVETGPAPGPEDVDPVWVQALCLRVPVALERLVPDRRVAGCGGRIRSRR